MPLTPPITQAQLDAEINASIPDNTVNAVTPADVRNTMLDMSAATFQFQDTPVNVFSFMTSAQVADVQARTLTQDVTSAIVAAINSLAPWGGEIDFPPGKYKISGQLAIGNGTAGGAFSTLGPIKLRGLAAGPSVGYDNPDGGVGIISSNAGPAIGVYGPLPGWEIENIYIGFSTTNSAAIGIYCAEASFGSTKNVAIVDPPGTGIRLLTYGNNNCNLNRFENTYIFLGSDTPNSVGISLEGIGAADSSENTFDGLHIQPSRSDQTAIAWRYCDSNYFNNVVINPTGGAAATALLLDYAGSPPGFPGGNQIFMFDPFSNTITANAVPDPSVYTGPNRIWGFNTGDGAAIPLVKGLVVQRLGLSDNQIFYVSSTIGNDNANGLSPATQWATLQHAWNTIASYYDLNGFTATIQLADGTYSTNFVASLPIMTGFVVITGNATTPTNVVLSGTFPIVADQGTQFTVENVSSAVTNSFTILAQYGGVIIYKNVAFGPLTSGVHVCAQHGGVVNGTANYSITGGAVNHWLASSGGRITVDNQTITLTGTFAFSGAFAGIQDVGTIEAIGNTYSGGTVTGYTISVYFNGVINTAGGYASIPGSLGIASGNGGQYH